MNNIIIETNLFGHLFYVSMLRMQDYLLPVSSFAFSIAMSM